MTKLILSYYEPREEYDSAEVLLPFNYSSKESARIELEEQLSLFAQNWINRYRLRISGAEYPKSKILFAGHELNLNHFLNWGSNNLIPGIFEVSTIDEWWKENCKN